MNVCKFNKRSEKFDVYLKIDIDSPFSSLSMQIITTRVEPLSCDPLFKLEVVNKIYKTEFFPIPLHVKFPLSCEL